MSLFTPRYAIRRKLLYLFAPKFRIVAPDGALVGYGKQAAFRLHEDIRVYFDERMDRELLVARARDIIDFSAAYDVEDSATGRLCGTWRRKGFSSLVRDTWELSVDGAVVAHLREDNLALALVRRFLLNLIPQSYALVAEDGEVLATYAQRFNPFLFTLDVENRRPDDKRLERLVAAGGVLLAAIEGRQRN